MKKRNVNTRKKIRSSYLRGKKATLKDLMKAHPEAFQKKGDGGDITSLGGQVPSGDEEGGGGGGVATSLIGSLWSLLDEVGAAGKADYGKKNKYGEIENKSKNAIGGGIGAILDPLSFITDSINGENFWQQRKKGEEEGKKNRLAEIMDKGEARGDLNQKVEAMRLGNLGKGLNKGGIVKGKGGVDQNPALLKEESFVIPAEKVDARVRKVAGKLGLLKSLKKAKGGDVPVLLTKNELVVDPKNKRAFEALLKKEGIPSLASLAPEAKPGDRKVTGGNVDGEDNEKKIKRLQKKEREAWKNLLKNSGTDVTADASIRALNEHNKAYEALTKAGGEVIKDSEIKDLEKINKVSGKERRATKKETKLQALKEKPDNRIWKAEPKDTPNTPKETKLEGLKRKRYEAYSDRADEQKSDNPNKNKIRRLTNKRNRISDRESKLEYDYDSKTPRVKKEILPEPALKQDEGVPGKKYTSGSDQSKIFDLKEQRKLINLKGFGRPEDKAELERIKSELMTEYQKGEKPGTASKTPTDSKIERNPKGGKGSGTKSGEYLAEQILGGAQIFSGMLGAKGMGKAPILDPELEREMNTPFNPVNTRLGLGIMEKQSHYGMDPKGKTNLLRSMKERVATDTALATDISSSSAEAFNRIQAGSKNHLDSIAKLEMDDAQLKEGKRGQYAGALIQSDPFLASLKEKKERNKLMLAGAKQGLWDKESDAWSGLMQAGMQNTFGGYRANRFWEQYQKYGNPYQSTVPELT